MNIITLFVCGILTNQLSEGAMSLTEYTHCCLRKHVYLCYYVTVNNIIYLLLFIYLKLYNKTEYPVYNGR